MHGQARVEKFASNDLLVLHSMLMDAALENSQASEVLAGFLRRRGYGVHAGLVQDAVLRLDDEECEPEQMQAELERVALLM